MRLATLLNQDLSAQAIRDINVDPSLTGRLLATRWISERLAQHPDVHEFAAFSCGAEYAPGAPHLPDGNEIIPGICCMPFETVGKWLSADAAWIEPARHYWWQPATIRQAIGKAFPIVSLMYSIGYIGQSLPLIASLASPRYPGDVVVAPSQVSARAFSAQCASLIYTLRLPAPPPDVVVVPYGVPAVVHNLPQEIARDYLGWDVTPIVLFVGRLHQEDKADFRALFEATARLAAQAISFRLVLAGAGTDADVRWLKALALAYGIGEIATIQANVSETDKHLLLSACDVFVSPSNTTSESFGLSIVEAMLHARPIVCTAWSGYREIVRDGIDGLLVNVWWGADASRDFDLPFTIGRLPATSMATVVAIDVAHLTDCLKRVISSRELSRRFGLSGRKRALRSFSLDRTVENLVSVLKDARKACTTVDAPPRHLQTASTLAAYANRMLDPISQLTLDHDADLSRLIESDVLLVKRGRHLLDYLDKYGTVSAGMGDAFQMLRRGLLRVSVTETAPAKEEASGLRLTRADAVAAAARPATTP
jgi:glycosyltransferase involved in cell wall biosynthesis